jgi:hypothetical protein
VERRRRSRWELREQCLRLLCEDLTVERWELRAAPKRTQLMHEAARTGWLDIAFEVVMHARGRFVTEGLEPERITQGDTLLALPAPKKKKK